MTGRDRLIGSSHFADSFMNRDRQSAIPHPDDIRSALSVKALMMAGVHLGHCPENWNRNMLPYIYGERNRIHIINLEHTLTELRRACAFLRHVGSIGGNILFVGKRPQLHTIVYDASLLSSSYYTFVWNNDIMHHNSEVFDSLAYKGTYPALATVIEKVGSFPLHTVDSYVRKRWWSDPIVRKSTRIRAEEIDTKRFRNMRKMDLINRHYPDAVIVLDYMNCCDVIASCNKVAVPVVAICDTDCDPNVVQYAIPGNDDSLDSVGLITGVLSLSIKEGMELQKMQRAGIAIERSGGPRHEI